MKQYSSIELLLPLYASFYSMLVLTVSWTQYKITLRKSLNEEMFRSDGPVSTFVGVGLDYISRCGRTKTMWFGF